MEFTAKASLNNTVKTKNIIYICIVGCVALLGLVLAVSALVHGKILFSIIYFLACLLGISYVIIQINTILPTYVATAGDKLIIQNWENGIFSYNVAFRPTFLCDFVPDKTKISQVEISKITKLLIGTKSYLARNVTNMKFTADMEHLEKINPRCARLLKKMDLLYLETIDGEYLYMSLNQFDATELVQVLTAVQAAAPGLQIRCNNRELRQRMTESAV